MEAGKLDSGAATSPAESGGNFSTRRQEGLRVSLGKKGRRPETTKAMAAGGPFETTGHDRIGLRIWALMQFVHGLR